MKCTNCEDNGDHDIKLVAGYDDPNTGFAYNLHQCEYCGFIYLDNVWKNKGVAIINPFLSPVLVAEQKTG